MIRLKQVDVKNYRSCISTRLELSSNLAALIGMNGVGKTNILSSILLLKKIKRANRYIETTDTEQEGVHSKLEFKFDIDGVGMRLKADFYFDNSEDNDDIIYSKIRCKNQSDRNAKWIEIDDEFFEYIAFAKRRYDNRKFEEILVRRSKTRNFSKEIIELVAYLTNISYYSATQFSDPSRSPISLELDDTRLAHTYSFGKSKTHEVFLYDLYNTSKDEAAFERYLSVVKSEGLGLVDDIKFSEHAIPSSAVKVVTGGILKTVQKTKRLVVPSIEVDGLRLSPNQLSEGTFKTLALVFYILNDATDLLLIEEPEVCVHHGLLDSIVELIKIQSKSKQIIISTHSDYVVDKLSPEEVILVRKTKERGTKSQALTKTLSKNDYRALKEYLKESGNLGEYWKESGFADD